MRLQMPLLGSPRSRIPSVRLCTQQYLSEATRRNTTQRDATRLLQEHADHAAAAGFVKVLYWAAKRQICFCQCMTPRMGCSLVGARESLNRRLRLEIMSAAGSKLIVLEGCSTIANGAHPLQDCGALKPCTAWLGSAGSLARGAEQQGKTIRPPRYLRTSLRL